MTSNAVAQKQAKEKKERKVFLYGQVFDSFTKNYLDSAIVTVMAADSSVINCDTARTHRSATEVWGQNYYLTVPAKPAHFIIKAEAPNYTPSCINYELKRIGRNGIFYMPAIYLKRTKRSTPYLTGEELEDHQMDEFVVKASKVQLVWKGDTMVFDATAFNLAEGSMLDDLIRQLPGVELKENGEILVNGEKIDYLTLNGKDFFKGNNKMMLENLPYFTVKDVKVFRKSTPESEYLGYDVAKKDYVMDVSLKREYATGVIANAEIGGGVPNTKASLPSMTEGFSPSTGERGEGLWLARAFGLHYTDNSRLTLFGNANNINENRHPGSEGEWTPSEQPMGLRTYESLNANYHYERPTKWNDEVSANLTWDNTENESRTSSSTYLQTGDVFSRSQNANRNKSFSLNADNRFTLQGPQTPFFLYMATNFQTSPNRSWSDAYSETFTNDTLTNCTLSKNYNEGRNWHLVHLMWFRKKLPWGDNIGLAISGNYQESSNDSYQHYDLDYFRPTTTTDYRNEYRPNRSHGHNWNASFTYTISLGKGWNLDANYSHAQDFSSGANPLYRLDRDADFMALSPSIGELPLLNAELQDIFNSQWTSHWKQQDHGSLQLNYANYKPNVGFAFLDITIPLSYQREQESYTRWPIDTTVTQKNILFDPRLSFQYSDMRHNNTWNITYRHSTQTPTITDLIGYRDASNPLSVRLGNPDLHNSSRHVISADFSHSVPRHEQTFRIASSYDVTIGQIMQTYDYDSQSGAYTYRPKNVNGNWWWDGSVNFTTTLDSAKHWRLTEETRFVRHNVAYATNGLETTTRRFCVRERLGLNYKLNERFDVEPLVLAEWERAWSPLETYKTTNIWDISYGVNLHWRLPWELQLSTDLREYHRRGFEDSSLNTNHLIWNAQLTRSFFKGQLTAKLVGYDMLGQISHTSWKVGSEGISSTWQRGIPSYVMAHLAWKFSRKPKK